MAVVSETLAYTVTLQDDASVPAERTAKAVGKIDDAAEKTNKSVSALSKAMSVLTGALKLAWAAATAGAAALVSVISAVIFSSHRAAMQMDAMGDSAERLGVSVEFLSKMQFAAKFADLELGELTASLGRLNVAVGRISQGDKGLAQVFARLGVSIRDAGGAARSNDQVFNDLADAFSKISDPAEKATLAAQIFGQQAGPKLLLLLSQGSEGIRMATAEAERFGVVVSQRAAQNAANYGDAIDRLGFAFQGLRNAIAGDLLPAMTEVVNFVAGFIADNRGAIVEMLRKTLDLVVQIGVQILNFAGNLDKVGGALVEIANRLGSGLGRIIATVIAEIYMAVLGLQAMLMTAISAGIVMGVAKALPVVAQLAMGFLNGFLSVMAPQLQNAITQSVGNALKASQVAADKLSKHSAQVMRESFAAVPPMVDSIASKFGTLGAVIAEAIEPLRALANDPNGLGSMMMQMWLYAQSFLDVMTRVNEELQTTNAELARTKSQLEQIAEALGRGVKQGFEDIAASAGNVAGKTSSALVGAFNSIESAAASAFAGIIDGSMSAKEAFQSFVKAFIAALIGMIAQLLAAIVIALIFAAVLSLATAGGSAAAGSAAFGAALGSIGGIAGAVGGLATGAGGATQTSAAGAGGASAKSAVTKAQVGGAFSQPTKNAAGMGGGVSLVTMDDALVTSRKTSRNLMVEDMQTDLTTKRAVRGA